MGKFISIIISSILMFPSAKAQKNETRKNIFIRVYDSSYSKMGKGNLLYGSDSAIMIIRRGRIDTFSVKQVYYIKTKRSAGHSVLMGTGIGTGMGLTVITFGVFVVSGDGVLNASKGDDHSTQHAVALLSPVLGAAIGGAVGVSRKRETFEIDGNSENWKAAREKLLNTQN